MNSVFLLAVWHVFGGNASFNSFLKILADGTEIKTYDSVAAMPFESAAKGDVFFLMPEYAQGKLTIPEQDAETETKIRKAARSGSGFYFECREAYNSYGGVQGLQSLGMPRYFYQEYVMPIKENGEWTNCVLQARRSYFIPSAARTSRLLATLSNVSGTRKVSKKGHYHHPVVACGATDRVVGAAMDLSRFDPAFMRPYGEWKKFYAEIFSRVTALPRERVAAAMERMWGDPCVPAEQVNSPMDLETTVRNAVEWHFKSGLMPKPDGSAGIYEMIRSSDLEVRKNLRTDAALLTGAMLVKAAKRCGKPEWREAGLRIVDFMFANDVLTSDGTFRWYVDLKDVYPGDFSRDGLALVSLWKETGDEKFHALAKKAADRLLVWLGEKHLVSEHGVLGKNLAAESKFDNPVVYGEMAMFLLQLGEEKYVKAMLAAIDNVMAKFPNVTPFGFSDNFTYARCLEMLAAAQLYTDRDCSVKINYLLDFFLKYRHPSGGIEEAPIRLLDSSEAGVGMGDGTDHIADNLYCENFVFYSLAKLRGASAAKRTGIDWKKVETLHSGLKEHFLATQIRSSDPRLSGGWMRSFDLANREYFGLNRDMDWGAYSIMAGWTMGFVPLALMEDNDDK